jgi:hypothetical protein
MTPCTSHFFTFPWSCLYAIQSSHRRGFHGIITERCFMGRVYPFDYPSGGRATSRECEPPKYKNTFHLTPLQECMPTSSVVPASATPRVDLAWLENAYVDVASSVSTIPWVSSLVLPPLMGATLLTSLTLARLHSWGSAYNDAPPLCLGRRRCPSKHATRCVHTIITEDTSWEACSECRSQWWLHRASK